MSQKVPPKYWTFLAKSYHANDRDKNMSLFTNSSRQLRRITEQSISILKVSQNANTIQHLSFSPSKKKAKHIMVNMKSTQAFLHFECNTQVVVFILNKPNCSSSPRRRYFSFSTRNTFQKSTRKVKTQNNNVSILKRKEKYSPFLRLHFYNDNLMNARSAVAHSRNRILQKHFQFVYVDLKMLISVLTPKLNHS
jgi:hypothetical protein